MLEMDVRLTKDNKLIVCHDENLDRLCGDKRNVCDVNFSELPKFQKNIPIHFNLQPNGQFKTYDFKPGD